jgi:hypothetical protein
MTPNTFVVGAGVETGPSEVSGTVGKTGEGVSGVGVTTWGVGEGFVGGFEGALVGGSPVLHNTHFIFLHKTRPKVFIFFHLVFIKYGVFSFHV